MKLKEYLESLEKLYEEHGDIEVYYSIDEEGNDYKEVYYSPSFNYMTKDDNENYLIPEEDICDGTNDDCYDRKELRKVIVIN